MDIVISVLVIMAIVIWIMEGVYNFVNCGKNRNPISNLDYLTLIWVTVSAIAIAASLVIFT